jgi:hypothetical protein
MKYLKTLLVVTLVLVTLLTVSPARADDGTGAAVGATAQLVYVLLGALAGGLGAVGAMLMGVRFVLNSPVLIHAMENLANSFPPEMKDLINSLGELLLEATDDVPYSDKDENKAVG